MDQSELRALSPVSSFHFLQNLDPIGLTVVADMSLLIITKMILMVVKTLFGSVTISSVDAVMCCFNARDDRRKLRLKAHECKEELGRRLSSSSSSSSLQGRNSSFIQPTHEDLWAFH